MCAHGDLAQQLDLAIYELPDTFWWYRPLVIIVLACFILSIAIAYFWYKRYMHRRVAVKVPEQLTQLLEHGLEKVKSAHFSSSDMLVLLTSVLKSYTAWRCDHDGIHAMTDEQWLAYIARETVFTPVLSECQSIIQVAGEVKFSYSTVTSGQLRELVDRVLHIIHVTLPKTSSDSN